MRTAEPRPIGGHPTSTVPSSIDSTRPGRALPPSITVSVSTPRATTTTLLAAQPVSAPVGQPIAFTANVSGTTSCPGSLTGSVSFRDGAVQIGPNVALAGGQATLTTSALGLGTHSITAAYSGDPSFAASTSTPSIVVVSVAQGSAPRERAGEPNVGRGVPPGSARLRRPAGARH